MTSDPRSSDFSYKKYSLEQLDNWLHDSLNCEDLTPEDIYDTIVNVVNESIEYHKKYLNKSTALLYLLKGRRSVEIDTSLDDIDASSGVSSATEKDWVDFWEENYYPEEYHQSQKNPFAKKKWVLPVEEVGDEYCITFPEDLLKEANLKEGDSIDWIDRGDGSYELRKITKPIGPDEC